MRSIPFWELSHSLLGEERLGIPSESRKITTVWGIHRGVIFIMLVYPGVPATVRGSAYIISSRSASLKHGQRMRLLPMTQIPNSGRTRLKAAGSQAHRSSGSEISGHHLHRGDRQKFSRTPGVPWSEKKSFLSFFFPACVRASAPHQLSPCLHWLPEKGGICDHGQPEPSESIFPAPWRVFSSSLWQKDPFSIQITLFYISVKKSTP